MQETQDDITLHMIATHCLDVHEDRSVFDIPKICEYPLQAAYIMEWLSFTIACADNGLTGFISPDFAGTFVAIAFQQYMMIRCESFTPLYRFRKNGKIDLPASLENQAFVIIEDVVTTGTSVLPVIRLLKERRGKLLGIVTVINRPEGGGESLLREYGIPFYFLYTTTQIMSYYRKLIYEK